MNLHPRITQKLIEGIRIPIADYELVMFDNQYMVTQYIFRKIRSKIEQEVVMNWCRVLATDRE